VSAFPSAEYWAYLKSCAPTSMARRMADAIAQLRSELATVTAERDGLLTERHEYVVKLDALREEIHQQAIAGREDSKLIAELHSDSRRSDSLRVAEVTFERLAQAETRKALEAERAAHELEKREHERTWQRKALHIDERDTARAELAKAEARVKELEQSLGRPVTDKGQGQ